MNEHPTSFQDVLSDLSNPQVTHTVIVDPKTLTVVALGIMIAVVLGILVVQSIKKAK